MPPSSTPARSPLRRVLGSPGVLRTVLPYGAGRIGTTMELLSVLLLTQHTSGSYASAGAITACYAAGAALVAPFLGRRIDRSGQTSVLLCCGVVHVSALVLVVLLAWTPGPVLVAVTFLAGSCVPPLPACMRALWPDLVPAELAPAGYTVDSLLIETSELLGPVLVGAAIVVLSAAGALLVAAALSASGCLLFALSPASRSWSSSRREPRPVVRGAAGPLRVGGVRRIIYIVLLSAAGLTALEVAVTRFARDHGSAALTGPLLAMLIVGSLVGGWLLGGRSWQESPPLQLALLLPTSAALGLLPLLATGTVSFGVFLALAGLLIAPATAVQFALMATVAPPAQRTEAFTWASSANFVGIAAGQAAAGVAVGRWGVTGGLVTAAVLAAAAAGVGVASTSLFAAPAEVGDVALAAAPRSLAVGREPEEALRAEVRWLTARCEALVKANTHLLEIIRRGGAPAQHAASTSPLREPDRAQSS